MSSRCTCGAELPPNAMFCHMCGRPQQEMPVLDTTADTDEQDEHEPSREERPKADGSISFGNSDAIRAAYPPAAIAAILASIPYVYLLCFLWYPAAGFASVYLYRMRTGIFLSPGQGARLGGIAGLLLFVIMLLVLTVGVLAGGAGDFTQSYRQAIEQSGQPEDVQRAVLQLMNNPATLMVVFAIGLAMQLVATAGLAVLGGALGAKVLEREG